MAEKKDKLVKQKDNTIRRTQIEKDTSKRKKDIIEMNASKYHLALIFIVLCIIPLIVRMIKYNPNMSQFPWFPDGEGQIDFFLYYKQWAFISVAGIMALIITYKSYLNRKKLKFSLIFIPLVIYALLTLLSAIFSKYASFAFSGSFEMFESVFALLGYCIVAYYSYLILNTENDFKMIYYFLISIALIMGIIGLSQFAGKDFFGTKLGYNLIIPEIYRGLDLTFNFSKNQVYLTLYNPNYVGVFGSLLIPIIFVMTLFQKKIIPFILSFLALSGLVVCIVGSKSLSGVIGLGLAALFIIIFMWRYLLRRFYITIPVIIIVVLSVFFLNKLTNQYFYNKVINVLHNQKTVHALTNLVTEDDKVSLTYNNNVMNVVFTLNNDKTASIIAYDQNNKIINSMFDPNSGRYLISDERFPNFFLGFYKGADGIFYIKEEDRTWLFTNLTNDGSYYYINRFNKLDKIITPPSAVFTGYESFASGRAYIWSRTIPLLKKYMFLGSGPDTFTMAFPQQDYLGLIQYGYGDSILTKPHNMYLQTGIQTGVLSLLAFLLFYLMYAISSIRLYIRGRFSSLYAKFGVATFVGTISYMVSGLTNDSNINTSPIFWVLMGVGIALNYKAKPIIMDEVAAFRIKKEEKKK